ncbi:MAG: hypothetical protein WBW33_07505 [Bryobacteraceae bacterium]
MRLKPGTARNFVKHVVPHVVKPARIVWNQVIGAAFLLVAVVLFSRIYIFYKEIQSDPHQGTGSLIMAIFGLAFAILLAGYGLSSFLRARRISRS